MPPAENEITGDYLMAFSAKLSPKKPVVFLVNITTPATANGVGVAMKLTPLSGSDGKTPVGPAVDIGPFDLGQDGQFSDMLPELTIPGAANRVQCGVEIVADASLCGHVCKDEPDFLCGEVGGKVVVAGLTLDLTGSTFAMLKITDASMYPVPVIDCDMTPADPPPCP